jgi:single-strand DNA-binding protein
VNRRSKSGDETMFIDIVAWDRLGEICNQYLKKGMSVLVEGRLSIRKYETKEGEKRTAVEVVASDMQMLDSKRSSAGGNGDAASSFGGSKSGAGGGDFGEEAAVDDEVPF